LPLAGYLLDGAGAHATHLEAVVGITRDGHLRGSAALPHPYFLGTMNPHTAAELEKIIKEARGSSKNGSGVIFEVAAAGEIKSAPGTAFYDEWRAAHDGAGGTYFDMAMAEEGFISHYKSKGDNRWSHHKDFVGLEAVWVEPSALRDIALLR
jgi:hypothetical protein